MLTVKTGLEHRSFVLLSVCNIDISYFWEKKKKKYEPAHDKTYCKTCVTSKDSDQPVHPPIMARLVLIYLAFDSLEAVEGKAHAISED